MAQSRIMLDDLFQTGNFRTSSDEIAVDYRRRFSLPPIHQLGIVVPDVEKAAAELEGKGIGPFFIAAGKPVLWRERDAERQFAGKMGIACHEGFELELLEPGTGSDFYRRSLDDKGRPLVQHLGFMVDDVDAWAKKLIDAGHPIYVRGKLRAFPMSADFAYMDTEDAAGTVIEFINWRLFGIRATMPPAIYHGIGKFEKLIGKRSLSL